MVSIDVQAGTVRVQVTTQVASPEPRRGRVESVAGGQLRATRVLRRRRPGAAGGCAGNTWGHQPMPCRGDLVMIEGEPTTVVGAYGGPGDVVTTGVVGTSGGAGSGKGFGPPG